MSGLVRTGRLFGGLIDDFKRKRPHYLSDFTDGFHPQIISSFLFLYFACLAPIVGEFEYWILVSLAAGCVRSAAG